MSFTTITIAVAVIVAMAVTLALTVTRFARTDRWIATVTPLASIIGSGFLVCGPLLAREFGGFAAPAMAALLILSFGVGAVIRFNIRYAEPHLARAGLHDRIAWTERAAQLVLAVAYAVSVAYYLKLLAAFTLRATGSDSDFVANVIVTAIILVISVLPFTGGLRRVEHVAHGSVSVKLGLIAGMLAALAVGWIAGPGEAADLPPVLLSPRSIFLLLGLLITVQGFETSRYMGEAYDQTTRINTMRNAQLVSSLIYIAFLVLLTPHLGLAAKTEGVAGVLDVMETIAPFLGLFVLAGAVASQLSAAVADSIGSSGIAVELSRGRLNVRTGFVAAGALAIIVTWTTNALSVIAVASRAFALFYAIQCVIAILVARADRHGTPLRYLGFTVIGALCLLAALAGAPAE